MSQHTPDAWIERQPSDERDDESDEIFDAECSRCGQPANSEESTRTDKGLLCPDCAAAQNPFSFETIKRWAGYV